MIKELEPYANNLMSTNKIENCIVTLSELGSVWYSLNKEIISYLPPLFQLRILLVQEIHSYQD